MRRKQACSRAADDAMAHCMLSVACSSNHLSITTEHKTATIASALTAAGAAACCAAACHRPTRRRRRGGRLLSVRPGHSQRLAHEPGNLQRHCELCAEAATGISSAAPGSRLWAAPAGQRLQLLCMLSLHFHACRPRTRDQALCLHSNVQKDGYGTVSIIDNGAAYSWEVRPPGQHACRWCPCQAGLRAWLPC